MEPAVEIDELMERIRRAADRENGAQIAAPGVGGSAPDLPPLSAALPRLMVSALTIDIVDQAKQMLPSAYRKNEVPKTVPTFLRPLFRNQGGFNGVLLALIERLITANRQLAEQMGKFRDWADAVGQDSMQNRAWAKATDLRLEAFRAARLVEIELRLNHLEQPLGERLQAADSLQRNSSVFEAQLADLLTRTERLERDRADRAELADQLHAQKAQLVRLEAQLARLQILAAAAPVA